MRTFCGPLLAVACACSGASATQLRGSIHQALAGTSMAPEDTSEAIIEFSREHCPEQLDACEKSSDCLPQIGGSKIPESAVANALYACFVEATSAEFSNGTSAELSNGTEALLETSSGLQAHADLASCSFDKSTVAACPSGYKNMGLTCFRGAHSTGKSRTWCRGNCPPGYTDMGCHCFRGAHSLGMSSMTCPPGWERMESRCCDFSLDIFQNL
jgi:hypothetical protein